jgi:hypothetical protein
MTPWQKEFALSRRNKGCHLVTDEVLRHIEEGIKDVEVISMSERKGHEFTSDAQVGMCFLFM